MPLSETEEDQGHVRDTQRKCGTQPGSVCIRNGDLEALTATEPETVHAAARRLRAGDAGDDHPAREWWKLACYWANDTQLFTTSPSLRPNNSEASMKDTHGDTDGPRWQFVGVARYGDLPAHITRDATLIRRERRRRPPPD